MSHNLAISRYSQSTPTPTDKLSQILESQDRIVETHAIIARINMLLARSVMPSKKARE